MPSPSIPGAKGFSSSRPSAEGRCKAAQPLTSRTRVGLAVPAEERNGWKRTSTYGGIADALFVCYQYNDLGGARNTDPEASGQPPFIILNARFRSDRGANAARGYLCRGCLSSFRRNRGPSRICYLRRSDEAFLSPLACQHRLEWPGGRGAARHRISQRPL